MSAGQRLPLRARIIAIVGGAVGMVIPVLLVLSTLVVR